MRFSYFFPLLIFFSLVFFLLKGLFIPQDAAPPSALTNKPLPEFSLPLLGKEGTLKPATFTGKFSLLNVFASWCASCRVEHPVLMDLAKNQVIPIYGISWKDQPEDTKKWLGNLGNPYTDVGIDIKGKTIIDLGVTGAPETFLISPEGTILYKYTGPLSKEVITKEILPVMQRYMEEHHAAR